MTAAQRYGEIADGLRATATSTRDLDERTGRALRELQAACIEVGAMLTTGTWDDFGVTYRVNVLLLGHGQQVTEVGDHYLEVLDKVRDRLNREEWDA